MNLSKQWRIQNFLWGGMRGIRCTNPKGVDENLLLRLLSPEICLTLKINWRGVRSQRPLLRSDSAKNRPVADPGGPSGPWPPSPVKISHKKDGRQRWPHRFHVSWPPPPLPSHWIRYCRQSVRLRNIVMINRKCNHLKLFLTTLQIITLKTLTHLIYRTYFLAFKVAPGRFASVLIDNSNSWRFRVCHFNILECIDSRKLISTI